MREIAVGDAVRLHQTDGSFQLYFVVNRISPTEVQLNTFDANGSTFYAATAPVYRRGTQPGQWEPTNEAVPERLRWYGESLRMSDHPASRALHSLLTVKLPDDIEEVFSMVGRIYADKDVRSPFYEVQHRDEPFNNNDYFYNLLMMGVQEGLRSSLYFLRQFLLLANEVKIHGTAIVGDVKPSRSGVFGVGPGVLNAEYEGFVLLSRATLDRLTYFLKYYFQIKNNDPNLYKFIEHLEKKHRDGKRAQHLIEVINRHRTYLNTQLVGQGKPTERNRLAHQEYVEFALPNIRYNPDGTVQVAFVYGENLQVEATEELADRFNKLKLFIIDVLNEFFTE